MCSLLEYEVTSYIGNTLTSEIATANNDGKIEHRLLLDIRLGGTETPKKIGILPIIFEYFVRELVSSNLYFLSTRKNIF